MTALNDLILADSPAIYLDCQGATVTDASGNNRAVSTFGGLATQQATDPAAPAGVGNSIRFDGTDDYLALADGGSWFTPATNGYTIELWLHWRGGSQWQRVWDFANAASTDDMFFTPQDSNGVVRLSTNAGVTTAQRNMASNSWVHVAQTVTSAGARVLYLNGGVMASGTGAVPVDRARANMYIGRSQYSDPYLNASMSRLAIYNKVLTPAQIRARYRAGQGTGVAITDPRDIPGLLAWYSAQEVGGVADGTALTAWSDKSGYHRDTVAVNGTPTYRATSGPDGGPCIEFDGNEFFTLPDVLSGLGSGYVVAGFWSTAGGNNVGGWEFGTNSQASHLPYSNSLIYDDFGSTARRDTIAPLLTMNGWHRLSAWSAPSDWALLQNGEPIRTDASNTVSFHSQPKVGTAVGWASGQHRVAFVALLDHKPSQAERDALEAYFESNPSGGAAAPRAASSAPVVSATPLDNATKLTWTTVQNAETYEYRVDGGTPVDVGLAKRTIVTGLNNGVQSSIEVRGVNSLGPGPWGGVEVTPIATALYDDFDRPNSSTAIGSPLQGGPYTVRTGTWGINNSSLYCASNTGEAHVTFPGAVDFDATVRILTPGNNGGMLFRWIDASNTWLFQFHTSQIALYRRVSGSWIQRGPSQDPVQAGDVLRLLVKGDKIFAYRNGRLILVMEDPYIVAATPTMGFRFSGDTTSRVDEVLVHPAGDLPTLVGSDADETIAIADSMQNQGFIYKGRDNKLADEGALA